MIVNGRAVHVEQGQTLYDFLTEKNYNLATVAVERNGEIVPKSSYNDVQLKEEDKLEIVQFVGGG